MHKFGTLSAIFFAAGALLSHAMCAVTAYHYAYLQYIEAEQYGSAPPETALLLAIPFLAGIVVCVILAFVFRKKRA